jgi:hypothetical protein
MNALVCQALRVLVALVIVHVYCAPAPYLAPFLN